MSNLDDERVPDDDVNGPMADAAMTVSEEELVLGTRWHPSARVRLVKHIVTETQMIEVEVSREELRIEREPAEGADGPAAEPEPWQPFEIILSREEVVAVQKRVVASDRVTVHKDLVTEQRRVETDLRHEEVVVEERPAPGSFGRSLFRR